MKNFYLWIIVPCILSCTDDTAESHITVLDPHVETMGNHSRITGLFPENPDNEFDLAGQLHNEISDAYVSLEVIGLPPATIIRKADSIAATIPEYLLARPLTYTAPDAIRISYLLDNPSLGTSGVIAASGATTAAKQSVTIFVDSLMLMKNRQAAYDSIYNFIIDYEAGVLNNTSFTLDDKKLLLTTSSIARYAFYFASKPRRKPRDRDWDISMGHLAAGIEGAAQSQAKAVSMAVAAGLIGNN